MKTINCWFRAYEISHQHPANCAIHFFAVPAIVLSTLGLLWSLPFPISAHPLINWASILVCGALIFAFKLSWRLTLGLTIAVSIILMLLWWLSTITSQLALLMGVIFIVAWICQFFGHHIEGKRPSLFNDLQFFIIGPMWIIAKLYQKANIPW